ncbi:TNF receptor-associated factor homolog 1a-like [Papaver somniferum]|uniref:TNF receptor-associated factor homolog 1a-like n=1 Tax=Papaver somniferum TaxID=3469 RepID=UPI000E6FA55B|nr:TNF receptor-associated factor homolog 1a-like [Papaver somniferum]
MSGSLSEDSGVGRLSEGISSGHRYQSGEALAEWRSCEQVENGTPSTSPPYWDIDDDDDCGLKPAELYGKFTWKIDNFSQISKRELRSNAFEVGGYKWYILIYPQGCDVCNHLSLFLCVANHDKLLPGWSHFAQFTIAVVNKDPKKSKYSDTLHRFWKKEHDWGWKKFMELTKVMDGFVVNDTLVIKAQVQVIREKSDRPFRCLDCQYRRELVRVYLSNVEQICRRFVEERRKKLGDLLEDSARWSSFCAFWLGVDQNVRRRMSREKTDVILKVVVKQFFVEKEVTSTLVMDSLYSGLKALECQSKSKTVREKVLDTEESPTPIVRVENDMFTLVDDVLLLLERAALEPLPPKDEKGPQNRTKDGNSGEDTCNNSMERDERRLTELGRRTVEIFALTHIFSNRIEVAYQEAVALKRQEELIREEEEAWQAESEQKAKRGAADKEKRAKKKQSKQKRSSRKGKDKGRSEKLDVSLKDKMQSEETLDRAMDGLSLKLSTLEKPDTLEDVSDVDEAVDVTKTLQVDLEDRDVSPVNWDTDTSEVHAATETSSSGVSGLPIHQNGRGKKKNTSVMDDSSSTCSTDSVPSVVMNGPPYKGNTSPYYKRQTSASTRGKNQRGKETLGQSGWVHEMDSHQQSESAPDAGHLQDLSGACTVAAGPESLYSLKDRIHWLEQHLVEKEEEVSTLQKKLTVKDLDVVNGQKKHLVEVERPDQRRAEEASSGPTSFSTNLPSNVQWKPVGESVTWDQPYPVKITSPNSLRQTEKVVHAKPPSPQVPSISKPEANNICMSQSKSTHTPSEKATPHQVAPLSRPLSAPLVPGPRPTAAAAAVVSIGSTTPVLARSYSAAGRLGTDSLPETQGYASPSYRNAIMGKTMAPTPPAGFAVRPSSSAVSLSSPPKAQPSISTQVNLPPNSARKDQNLVRPGFTFGSVTPEILQNRPQWMEGGSPRDTNPSSMLNHGIQNLDVYGSSRGSTSAAATQGVSSDEFPHLDIINFLFEEEHSIGKVAEGSAVINTTNSMYHHHQQHSLNRQFTFPGDLNMSGEAGGPSINSCRFQRQESYHHDDLLQQQQLYGSSSGGSSYEGFREVYPVVGMPYGDGQQIDGMIDNQWSVAGGGTDLSLLSLRNTAMGDGYLYHQHQHQHHLHNHHQLPEYSNLACDVNGYPVFQPSNGFE